ncbi:MAG: RNA-directed DNA polymerase [Parasphingorhabdus sp.]|jgi:RNA-directed DNA polymerase
MRIAELSRGDCDKQFDSLMHHFNVESLRECYQELDGKKALGADGVSKEKYGEYLEGKLSALVERLRTMSYRPSPVRQVLIPKEGQAGRDATVGYQ